MTAFRAIKTKQFFFEYSLYNNKSLRERLKKTKLSRYSIMFYGSRLPHKEEASQSSHSKISPRLARGLKKKKIPPGKTRCYACLSSEAFPFVVLRTFWREMEAERRTIKMFFSPQISSSPSYESKVNTSTTVVCTTTVVESGTKSWIAREREREKQRGSCTDRLLLHVKPERC